MSSSKPSYEQPAAGPRGSGGTLNLLIVPGEIFILKAPVSNES